MRNLPSDLSAARKALSSHASREKAKLLQRFFKTGPGQYGEGDIFIGVMVPQTRAVARAYPDLSLGDLAKLLRSKIHEERLLALIILVERARRLKPTDSAGREKLCRFYLSQTARINNWDLVDLSAPQVVGVYLFGRSDALRILKRLAHSKSLWERRIALLATFYFIKQGSYGESLHLARLLMNDPEPLLHKALGWMLREIGKKDQRVLERFLDRFTLKLPRTALRYSIERLPERLRKKYMEK